MSKSKKVALDRLRRVRAGISAGDGAILREADACLLLGFGVHPWKVREVTDRLRAAVRGRRDPALTPDPSPQAGELVLHFDGGVDRNPGTAGRYGWHADAAGVEVGRGSGRFEGDYVSNNVAEWRALEAGLRFVAGLPDPPAGLLVRGDSQLVIYQLTGRYGCGKPHLAALRNACRSILAGFAFPWRAEWVRRERNARADALAACRGRAD